MFALDAVCRLCRQSLTQRLGRPFHLDAAGRWQDSQFCVLGLGKLGGQELNYSSDVDVLFVYSEEGNVFKSPPRPDEQTGKGLSNHQFFTRLAEKWIAEIAPMTPDGSLFRIDVRLRPEGKAGPLVRSLESYENYYAQWGQTWERMMLIKARPVAGDAALGAEFVEMVQPFRYPRSLSQRTLREVAAVKKRIEKEIVKAGELERNVKLGRGGIREIEFIVQTLQILHAGRIPFLQGASTVPVLRKLAEYSLLSGAGREAVGGSLPLFARCRASPANGGRPADPHHSHRPPRPRAPGPLDGLCLPGRPSKPPGALTPARCAASMTSFWRATNRSRPPCLPGDAEDSEQAWQELFSRHSFRDPARAWQMVQMFLHGPGYVHVSPRTVELARELLPRFLALCPQPTGGAPRPPRPAPSFPTRIVSWSGWTVLLTPTARGPLCTNCGRRSRRFSNCCCCCLTAPNSWRKEPFARPTWLMNWNSSGRVRRQKSAAETLRDLRHGAGDADQRLWLRRYHQAELMRIGLRDILGLADFEQNLLELSALADACLQYALEVVCAPGRFKSLPLCVVGLGKLGGREINYGSDLDIVFVTHSGRETPPATPAPGRRRFGPARQHRRSWALCFILTHACGPTAKRACSSTPLEACEEYYRRRAALWEIQALTRVRPIAGDLEAGAQFQQLAAALADFSPENVAAGFAASSARASARAEKPACPPTRPAGKRKSTPCASASSGNEPRPAKTAWPSRPAWAA